MILSLPEGYVNIDNALFRAEGDTYLATEYARGPWDPDSCHGGPVAALLVRAVEQVDGDDVAWHLARVTLELMRPVPVGEPLSVTTTVERPGRKVSLVGASAAWNGRELVRMRALRIRMVDLDVPADVPPGSEPPLASVDGAVLKRMESPGLATSAAFHSDGVEHRYTKGGPEVPGPVELWIRLLVPVIAGEKPSGAQRAVAAADFGNGVSAALPFDQFLFINPDLTVHLARPPEGEWIGMRSSSQYEDIGVGLAESALFDAVGQLGRSAQSLLIETR